MTLTQDAHFAGMMVRRLSNAARMNFTAGLQARRLGRPVGGDVGLTNYDPLDPSTSAHPHEWYRRLHDGPRVHYNSRRALWILTRADDVRAAARADTQLSSADGVTRSRFAAPILITTDGEQHAQMRRHVLPAFTKSALANWRIEIDRLAVELVQDVFDNPGCDIVQRLAVPMPTRLIARLLGVPDSDVDDFRRWSEGAIQATELALTPRGMSKWPASIGGTHSIYRYFRRQFKAGGLKGSDTILGRLLTDNEDGTVSDDELFFFAFLLLLAGNETTTNLLGGMFDAFARHPDQYDIVRQDPSLIPMAVEELLRYISPVQNLYRTARTDYQVGDTTIPRGARVQLSFGAGNRDPRVFEDPDAFLVRRNPTQHIAFGFGAHFCLGAQLTRFEAQAVLREVVARTTCISITSDTTWSTNSSLRGPASLPVRMIPS